MGYVNFLDPSPISWLKCTQRLHVIDVFISFRCLQWGYQVVDCLSIRQSLSPSVIHAWVSNEKSPISVSNFDQGGNYQDGIYRYLSGFYQHTLRKQRF
jgi:hypothetical protein